ncbi:hypothetical protein [uncultured Bacteroides sp.]|uniref:hypothetical protein n=1 Tax=uncultured Bacteroides sp. TaxID=162156 RepID=UPI00260C6465|nr:hypothetical protein [uncultured Bacteroides sp.]
MFLVCFCFYFFFLVFLLLFLFGGKKKKVTKRKTAVCSFKAAARLRPAEAQELASLKQPALLFAVLRFFAFRLEMRTGFFAGLLFALRPLGEIAVWGGGAFACVSLLSCFAFCFVLPFGRNRCVGRGVEFGPAFLYSFILCCKDETSLTYKSACEFAMKV